MDPQRYMNKYAEDLNDHEENSGEDTDEQDQGVVEKTKTKKKKRPKHYLQETKAFVYSKTDKAEHGQQKEVKNEFLKFGPGYG